MPKEVIDRIKRMALQEHAGTTLLFKDRDHNKIIDPDHGDDDDSAYESIDNDENDDDDDNDDNDDDDDNNILINQPNEGHNDPGILGEQNAQQDDNEEDNNEDDIEDNNNNNDSDKDADANTHDDDQSVKSADTNENALQNVHGEDPGGTTGVEPLPLIQVQNDRTQCKLNRIAWMGQQPATFAGHMRAQSRANATTNVTIEQNMTTEFERDLFHR